MKEFYQRNLPHWHPERQMFFITFRLANSLPVQVIQDLKVQRENEQKIICSKFKGMQQQDELYKLEKTYFGRFDQWLDHCVDESPRWLVDERIGSIVADEIHKLNGERFSLVSYCIMSNHVHLLVNTNENVVNPMHEGATAFYPLADTMKLLKGRTARYCN